MSLGQFRRKLRLGSSLGAGVHGSGGGVRTSPEEYPPSYAAILLTQYRYDLNIQ